MHKKRLHHLLKIMSRLSPWIVAILFVASTILAIYELRQNNLQMLRLKAAVLEADKNNTDVETALRNLRTYVYSHMNTALSSGPNAIKPPIQLKYRYERLQAAEKQRVDAANSGNSQIYVDAQAYCEKTLAGAPLTSRVACTQQYVSQHSSSTVTARPIPDALYKFDFVAPRWSPDLAGWSIVVSVLLGILLIIRLLLSWLLRRTLKKHL